MKIILQYGDDKILSYDTDFDPGFGHLITVMAMLFETIKTEDPTEMKILIDYVKK